MAERMDIGYIAFGVIFLVLPFLIWQLSKKAPEPEDETDDRGWGGIMHAQYLRARVYPFVFLLVGAVFIILGITR